MKQKYHRSFADMAQPTKETFDRKTQILGPIAIFIIFLSAFIQ